MSFKSVRTQSVSLSRVFWDNFRASKNVLCLCFVYNIHKQDHFTLSSFPTRFTTKIKALSKNTPGVSSLFSALFKHLPLRFYWHRNPLSRVSFPLFPDLKIHVKQKKPFPSDIVWSERCDVTEVSQNCTLFRLGLSDN